MEIETKQRKTDGKWVAKAYAFDKCLVRVIGESESAAREAAERELKALLEAELYGEELQKERDTTQQKINEKLEELRPYWRDHDWMTLDDVLETNGCRGIEYRYGKEIVWLYVDFQPIPKFTLLHVPEELFPDGKWFIGNCERKATCARPESALWRRHRENKTKYLMELEKQHLEAVKKVDPEEEARKRAERHDRYLAIEVRKAIGEAITPVVLFVGDWDLFCYGTVKDDLPRPKRFDPGKYDAGIVKMAILKAGGGWNPRWFNASKWETVEEDYYSWLEDDNPFWLDLVVDEHPFHSEFEEIIGKARELCEYVGYRTDKIGRSIRARVCLEGKEKEAVEWIVEMWEKFGWGDFLEGVR